MKTSITHDNLTITIIGELGDPNYTSISTRVIGVDEPEYDDIPQLIYNGIHASLAFNENALPPEGLAFTVEVSFSNPNIDRSNIEAMVAGATYPILGKLLVA